MCVSAHEDGFLSISSSHMILCFCFFFCLVFVLLVSKELIFLFYCRLMKVFQTSKVSYRVSTRPLRNTLAASFPNSDRLSGSQ